MGLWSHVSMAQLDFGPHGAFAHCDFGPMGLYPNGTLPPWDFGLMGLWPLLAPGVPSVPFSPPLALSGPLLAPFMPHFVHFDSFCLLYAFV